MLFNPAPAGGRAVFWLLKGEALDNGYSQVFTFDIWYSA